MKRGKIIVLRLLLPLCLVTLASDAWASPSPQTQPSQWRLDMMCGPNCLWQIAYLRGKKPSLAEVQASVQFVPGQAVSMLQMVEGSKKLGLWAQAVKTNLQTLVSQKRSAILLLENVGAEGHYVLLTANASGQPVIVDGINIKSLESPDILSSWNGRAIIFDKAINDHAGTFWKYAAWMISTGCLLFILILLLRNKLPRRRRFQASA